MPKKKQNYTRSVAISHDANDNVIITGDANKVVIYQTVKQIDVAPEADNAKQKKDIGPNPYLGLGAFQESDADRFFGREKLITILWEKFRDLNTPAPTGEPQIRLLPILGPSGSGKSSLARAGLIPELARHPLPGRKPTRVGVITPGSHPLESLALVLARIATDDPSPALKRDEYKKVISERAKEKDYRGLSSIADTLPGIEENPLVILVDQFEETYALCKDENERTIFIENLLQAAGDPSGRVSVVMTMRSDFIGETQAHTLLNTLVTRQGELVPAMNEDQLRLAIAKPAENVGHPLDEATISLLIEQTEGREGALPLLQFALTRIWDALPEKEPAETLKEIGGVGGALAGEAQRLYDSLDESGKAITKRAFLAMVQLGEGTRDTRRRVGLEQVISAEGEADKVRSVLQLFSGQAARLVTFSGDDEQDTIEVTHEALLDHWQELNKWLDGSRDDLRFQRRLENAAKHWDKSGRPEGLLWRPPDLDLLNDFSKNRAQELTIEQLDFANLSNAEELKKQKEKEKQQKIFKQFTLALGILLVLSLGLTWYAFNQQKNANKRELESNFNVAKMYEEKALAAIKRSKVSPFSINEIQEAWLSTLEALRQEVPKDSVLPLSLGVLANKEIRGKLFPIIWEHSHNFNPNMTFTLNKEGSIAAASLEDGTIRLWNIDSGEEIGNLNKQPKYISSLDFSPDGKNLLIGAWDKKIQLWNLVERRKLNSYIGHSEHVIGAGFLTNGKKIVSASDKRIKIWQTESGLLDTTITYDSRIVAIATQNYSSSNFAYIQDTLLHIWNIDSLESPSTLKVKSYFFSALEFSPDGKFLAMSTLDSSVNIWHFPEMQLYQKLKNPYGLIRSISFSSDNKFLATGSLKSIQKWNLTDLKLITHKKFRENESIRELKFLPNQNDRIILLSYLMEDRSSIRMFNRLDVSYLSLWDFKLNSSLREYSGNAPFLYDPLFSPNNELLAYLNSFNEIEVWSIKNGKKISSLKNKSKTFHTFGFTQDSRHVIAFYSDSSLIAWDAFNGNEKYRIKNLNLDINKICFSQKSNILAIYSIDNRLHLLDATSRKIFKSLDLGTKQVKNLAFSGIGDNIVLQLVDNSLVVYDQQNSKFLKNSFSATNSIYDVFTNPFNNNVFMSTRDKLYSWDYVENKTQELFLGRNLNLNNIRIDLRGQYLASIDWGKIEIWDVSTQELLYSYQTDSRYGPINMIQGFAFSFGNELIATVSNENYVQIWKLLSHQNMGILLEKSEPIISITVDPSGKKMVSTTGNNYRIEREGSSFNIAPNFPIRIWDLDNNKLDFTFLGHDKTIYCAIFNSQKNEVISGAADGKIHIWQYGIREPKKIIDAHNGRIHSLALSPNGELFVSAGADSKIKIFGSITKDSIRVLSEHKASVLELRFSPNGDFLASCSADNSIIIWDTKSFNKLKTLSGHTDYITCIDYSPDGNYLASISRSGFKIWDVNDGSEIWTNTSENLGYSISFSPDGNRILTTAGSSLKYWDVNKQKLIANLKGHEEGDLIFTAKFNQDGKTIYSGGSDRTLRIWDIELIEKYLGLSDEERGNWQLVMLSNILLEKKLRESHLEYFPRPIRLWSPIVESRYEPYWFERSYSFEIDIVDQMLREIDNSE